MSEEDSLLCSEQAVQSHRKNEVVASITKFQTIIFQTGPSSLIKIGSKKQTFP